MSFRELRNFCEVMRSLGYPRLISVDNFRTPNFELVADVLYWLVQRHDPDMAANISDDISTERERVDFLKNIAQAMASKARIRLNTKKLYGADGYAVKELLKVATVLYNAMRTNPEEEDDQSSNFSYVSLGSKLNDVKLTRSLASEITGAGAELYRLLGDEHENREYRQKAIGRNFELDEIEKSVRENVAAVLENVQNLEKMLQNLEDDQKTLDKKIEKKTAELDRNQKRLKSLATVRPAFMDEYERLEQELQKVYTVYLEKFRNVDYLEHELELYERSEQEKLEESDRRMKRLQKRLKEEELRMLRGEQEIDESMLEDGGDGGEKKRSNSEVDKKKPVPGGGLIAVNGKDSPTPGPVELGKGGGGGGGGKDLIPNGKGAGPIPGGKGAEIKSGKARNGQGGKPVVIGNIQGGGDSESESELGSEDIGSESGDTSVSIQSEEDLIDDDDSGEESDNNF
mmetsp:Transcript_35489/g.57414  ORF Transcript_35489/g.57414 Transcript_35489/m.57414 type:complete len:458 (-) Transcript_35489:864-2237(-)